MNSYVYKSEGSEAAHSPCFHGIPDVGGSITLHSVTKLDYFQIVQLFMMASPSTAVTILVHIATMISHAGILLPTVIR